MTERDIFIAARQRTNRAERMADLETACAGEEPLRRRMETVLAAHGGASALLKEPTPSDVATQEASMPPVAETRLDTGDVGPPALARTAMATYAPAGEGATKMLSYDEPFDPDGTSRPLVPECDVRGLTDFEILAQLGRGGMGVVYKARHRKLDRIVALKMILDGKHACSGTRERFLIEAQAVARLRHPNIVQIYDFGEADGHPFVTLELLEGGTLADRLKGTTQPGRAAAALVETLAVAMHAAHVAGIVHRDLKPPNILFDRDGTPKITDFGLAKRLEVKEGHTMMGQIMGTPSYMAPEQAQGDIHKIGPPADVYALGAMLYEMLTGRPPFKGSSLMETLHQVVYDDVVPPSRLVSRVARDLETICLKSLAKEPSRRYQSARELADDLYRYLTSQPIRARRTPLLERAAKWARRRPLSATFLALALITLAALVGAALEFQKRREADRVATLRRDTEQTLSQGQEFLHQRQWDKTQVLLNGLLTRIRDEPRLTGQQTRAHRLLQKAGQGLEARGRYQRFLQLHNEALFREHQFAGLNLPESEASARQTAQAALALFAPGGGRDTPTLEALPETLSAPERAEIVEGCYELLLTIAEATDAPQEGLRFLDQALRLHPEPTRAYYLRRAACLARRGDAGEAERARNQAEQIQPSSALDHFLTGEARYKRGDLTAALGHLEAALRLQPDHFWAHYLSAFCALQMNRPQEAALELRTCLERRPDFAWLYILRGYALGLIAVRARDEAARRSPASSGAQRRGGDLPFQDSAADFATASRLLQERPDNELRYVLLVVRGLARFQQRALDGAAEDLHAAIALHDGNFQAFVVLASVEQERGNPEAAFACYSRALETRPDWAPLYRARADVYLGLDHLDKVQRTRALNDLDQAITHTAPGDPVAARDHTRRAWLLHLEQRDQEALDACAAAVKIAPDYLPAHLRRLQILLDRKRDDEVLDACAPLVAKNPASAELYELRALARTRRGDYAGAIEDDTRALGLRPDWTRLLTRRGELYLLTQAPELARREFEQAIELDPANSDAYTGRAQARLRLGDFRAAVADAEESLRRGTPGARLYYNAARIFAQAAQAVTAEVRRKGRDTVSSFNKYQDRAVELATEAIRRVAPEERGEFWRNQIQADPALQLVARRIHFRATGPLTAADVVPSGKNDVPRAEAGAGQSPPGKEANP